jgi:thiosulfate dehydrogenase (quinone) large subunit
VNRKSVAYTLLRVTLGVLLLFSGVGKILEGPGEFVAGFVERFEETWLPGSLVALVGHGLPFIEIGIGALLVVGLVTVPALVAAGVLLVVFTFGTTVIEDHEATGRNLLYALIAFVLIWFSGHDRFGLDGVRTGTDRAADREDG